MSLPLDSPAARWLDDTPSSGLFARWPPLSTTWWQRLTTDDEDDLPMGSLVANDLGVIHFDAYRQPLVNLMWETPFSASLTRWPYESGTSEIALLLRSRGGAGEGIALRSVWPSSLVSEAIPKKQEIYPFVDPLFLAGLWPWLGVCAEVHGLKLPVGLDHEADHEVLSALSSENEVFTCVSCSSQDVRLIGSRVYACNDCGYEGGPGMAEQMRIKRVLAIERMTPTQRAESARLDLIEAKRMLLSAFGTAKRMESLTGSFANTQEENHIERHHMTIRLLSLVTEARVHLEDACIKDPKAYPYHLEPIINTLAFIDESFDSIMHGYHLDTIDAAEKKIGRLLGVSDDD